MKVFRDFRFEAAHALPDAPEGHKCRRLHGHSYRLRVYVEGPIDPRTGWVIDFSEIRRVVDPVVDSLDHRYLNDIDGLEKPTAEVITRWLWEKLGAGLNKGSIRLARLELSETSKCGCVYEGEDESHGARR